MDESDLEKIRETAKNHDFEVIRLIGEGRFGLCFLINSFKYQKNFVLKATKKEKSSANEDSFKREVEMLTHLCHPQIISIYTYFSDNLFYYIILEYAPNGSLENYVKKYGPIQEEHILRKIVRQVLEAISYIHSKGFTHHDIKPDNILLAGADTVKICDFGFACVKKACGDMCNHFTGSLPYMAPEVLALKSHDPIKADIWSLGISFYYIATGNLPFEGNTPEQYQKKFFGGYQSLPPYVPDDIRAIISSCIQLEPKNRPSANDLLKMIFITTAPLNIKKVTSVKRVAHKNAYPMIIRPSSLFSGFPGGLNARAHLTFR